MNNLREVTVGRDKNSDIYLDERCRYASSRHGAIYYDGSELMFRDTSSNGTMINNVMVHKRAVPIHRGDQIILAGKYPLSWNQIDTFFPPRQEVSQPQSQPSEPMSPARQAAHNAGVSSDANLQLDNWSWGAFGLSGLWGLFNGCWWIILINIVAWPLAPFVCIYLGVKGRRLAWERGSWSSAQDFIRTQHNWDIAGAISFGLSVLSSLIWSLALWA